MPNKRGAPFGNRNAYKHGFYSRAAPRPEKGEIGGPVRGPLKPEINLLRVLISRIAEDILSPGAQPLSFQQNMDALHTVAMAVARLTSLHRTSSLLYLIPDEELIQAFEALGASKDDILLIRQIEGGVPGNRRGGQPGNKNALKHGFYASAFRPEDLIRLEGLDMRDLDQVMSLLRVLIRRCLPPVLDADGARLSFTERQRAVRVIVLAVSCLEKLQRTKRLVFGEPSRLQRAVDEAAKQVYEELMQEDDSKPDA